MFKVAPSVIDLTSERNTTGIFRLEPPSIEQSDEVFIERLERNVLMHHAISFACFHNCVVAHINGFDDVLVQELLEIFSYKVSA